MTDSPAGAVPTVVAKKHILVDACVAAAAFAPKTTRATHLVERATTLLKGTSTNCQPQFLIPNFCIGETFAVFEKYRWGAPWNPQVKTRLTPRQFHFAREAFHQSIHNGKRLLQVELNRYHVLCLDLIAPINAAYRINRTRNKKHKKNVRPAGTYDLLFVAMGIWLQQLFGAENFALVTGDERIALIVKRAKSVKLARPMRQHLRQAGDRIGLAYSPDIYPRVVDLMRAKKSELDVAFAGWNPTWS